MSAKDDFPYLSGALPDLYYTRMCDEIDRLRQWRKDACEEFIDIRGQWGGDYLWEKHNETEVMRLLTEAGYDKIMAERQREWDEQVEANRQRREEIDRQRRKQG